MKVARTYTLDHEIVSKLQNINASELINRLLKDYFEAYSGKNTLLDEKNALYNQVLKKKRQISKEIKIINEWEGLEFDRFSKVWIRTRKEKPSVSEIKAYINNREIKNSTTNFIRGWELINKFGELLK
ncbi:hypothetical protein ES703_70260 [subsurface metagenome]